MLAEQRKRGGGAGRAHARPSAGPAAAGLLGLFGWAYGIEVRRRQEREGEWAAGCGWQKGRESWAGGWGMKRSRQSLRAKSKKGKFFLFYFLFKTKFNYEPNQIQIEFQIYFSIQIK